MKKNTLEFTGERLIPEANIGQAFYYEHLVRYFFASRFSKSKIVLDIACGTGYGCQIISTKGKAAKVVGIDISEEAIEFCNKYYKEDNINYLVDNAQTLKSQSSGTFDLIISFETIEHINHPEKFIEQTKRLLKNNGLLIISTPDINTYPKGNKYHINEQSPDDFRFLLKKYYRYTENYYQKFYLSNLISQNKETTFINIGDNLEVSDTNSEYLICICSDKKIQSKPGIINNINKIDQIDVTKGYVSLSNQFSNLYNENQYIQYKLNNLRNIQNELEQQLAKIYNSKIYKLWQKYNKIKKFFIKK